MSKKIVELDPILENGGPVKKLGFQSQQKGHSNRGKKNSVGILQRKNLITSPESMQLVFKIEVFNALQPQIQNEDIT